MVFGLMQPLPKTLRILRNPKGELKDHLIHLSEKEALEPSSNVCAGVRWLAHKRSLASKRLKRDLSWEEAVAEYKSVLSWKKSQRIRYEKVMGPFQELFEFMRKGAQ